MDRWSHKHYVVKERRLTFGRQYRVFDPDGNMVAYVKQKMFKLKEDIVFFNNEKKEEEVLRLKATKILDFNANLEILAPGKKPGGDSLGFWRRKGWKSMVRDQWVLMKQDKPEGSLHEDSVGMALFRRFGPMGALIPHKYHFSRGEDESDRAFEIKERFQFYGDTYDVHIHDGTDARVAVTAAVIVDAMESQ